MKLRRIGWAYGIHSHAAMMAAIICGGLGITKIVWGLTDVMVEGVTDYSYIRSQGYNYGDIDCYNQVKKFQDTITASGTGWTKGSIYLDPAVYDTDFRDPNVSGASVYDNDTNNFDRAATAIAFACGHGTCNDATGTLCFSGTNCPAGQACMNNPPTAYASGCTSSSLRSFVTSSASSHFNNFVYYGDGHSKFGETASWGGAGTNGGDMVVFIDNSCGVRPPFFFSEVAPVFVGVTQLNIIMPVSYLPAVGSADAWVYPDRGLKLATYAVANPNSTVSGGWLNNIDTAPQSTGPSCPDLNPTYTYGGGHGIGGCGAHISIAYDSSAGDSIWDIDTMSWLQSRNAGFRSNGNSSFYARYHCNYDCNTYPFNK